MILPTFIGIGPGRTGTSMIYELLLEHPEICMAGGTKETLYFNREYHRGTAWYAQFFQACKDVKAVGEITTTYFYDEAVPARIHELLPQVRLFSFLRNPFERMKSVYFYKTRSGEIQQGVTLEQAVDQFPELIQQNYYMKHLNDFYRYFPPDQLLVMIYDDLEADPVRFAHQLFQFIGVNPDFKSDVLFERVNAAAQPRSKLVGKIAVVASRSLRNLGLLSVLDYAKRSRFVRSAVLTSVEPQAQDNRLTLSQSTRRRLQEAWQPEVEKIETLLNRNLQHWLEIE